MNRNSWEAAQRSTAVGIELYHPMYDQLRAATRAALDAEGLSLENLAAANDEMLATEAERKKAQEEQEAIVRAEQIGNSLFLTAAIGLLPRVEVGYEGVAHFETINRDEAYHILDTALWFYNRPYWMAGYRYTDNIALLIPAAPSLAFFKSQFKNVFHDRHNYFSQTYYMLTKPYDRELSYSANDRSLFGRDKAPASLRFNKIPDTLRFAVHVNEAHIFTPAKKDRKSFKKVATTDMRPETIERIANTYDHREKAFVIDKSSPRVFVVEDQRSKLDPCKGESGISAVPTNVLNDFNVFDGLLRLMARFDKGEEYLQLMQRAKDGDIEKVVMEQQGIPVLNSPEATKKYLYDKARTEGWNPAKQSL